MTTHDTTRTADKSTKEEALLPCPFCGGEAEVNKHMVHTNTGGMGDYPSWGVKCAEKKCARMYSTISQGEVVKAWNTRALSPTQERAAPDEVMEALEDIKEVLDEYGLLTKWNGESVRVVREYLQGGGK